MSLFTVDVYAYSSDNIIRDPHAQGVIVKATQGTYYVSNTCNRQYALAKSLGKKLGLYHYAGGGNPVVEAQFFINQIKNYVGTALLILDWESYQNPAWGNTSWCRQFVDEVHRLTGVWPLIYCQESGLYQIANCANTCGVWVAKYASMNWNSWTLPNIAVSSGAFAAITGWQFTGGDMDRSIFYIDGDAWDRLANPNAKPAKVTSGGNLDGIHFEGNKLIITGWAVPENIKGKDNRYVILTTKDGKEVARQKVNPVSRPDVAKAFPDIAGGDESGFKGEFTYTSAMAGQKLNAFFRYTDDPDGNGNFADWVGSVDLTKSAASLDGISTVTFNNQLNVTGWFASNSAVDKPYRFLILYDVNNKKEIERVPIKPVDRPDVAKAYPDIFYSEKAGFSGLFKYGAGLVGHKLQVIARYSSDQSGEGDRIDYWFESFDGPSLPVVDGKNEMQVLVHEFSASNAKDNLISLKFK